MQDQKSDFKKDSYFKPRITPTKFTLYCLLFSLENAQRHEISDLQEELELMKTMEPHENLVNLLGYCPMRCTYVCMK